MRKAQVISELVKAGLEDMAEKMIQLASNDLFEIETLKKSVHNLDLVKDILLIAGRDGLISDLLVAIEKKEDSVRINKLISIIQRRLSGALNEIRVLDQTLDDLQKELK